MSKCGHHCLCFGNIFFSLSINLSALFKKHKNSSSLTKDSRSHNDLTSIPFQASRAEVASIPTSGDRIVPPFTFLSPILSVLKAIIKDDDSNYKFSNTALLHIYFLKESRGQEVSQACSRKKERCSLDIYKGGLQFRSSET